MAAGRWTHKKKLYLGEIYVFVIEKYIEDAKQDQKLAPHLVESMMRPTDPVKEELRRKTRKMNQFRPEITRIRVSTFWMSGNRRIPTGGQHSLLAQKVSSQ